MIKRLLPLLAIIKFFGQAPSVVTFNFTGGPQNWTVPPCVNVITVTAAGAQGGGPNGGNGAVVTGTFAVTPGQVLQIRVGGQGNCPVGGWNGGGNGGAQGNFTGQLLACGGGGASDVRVAPYALGNRIIVGAGGGGRGGGDSFTATWINGGLGGCPNGQNGTNSFGQGGGGGTGAAGGAGGAPWAGISQAGSPGALGVGGKGGDDLVSIYAAGGGGGGGLYGGGGGGADGCCIGANGGGAGGGGSSLVPPGGTCTQTKTGHGQVTIQYFAVNPVVNITPASTNICTGQTAVLTANVSQPGGTFLWNPGGMNTQVVNVSPAVNTVYTVTYNISGCTATAQAVVNVQPGIIPNPVSNSPICAGSNLNLSSAAGGSSYQWTGPNGFTSNQQNPTITNAQPVNSGVYNVTVTAPNGCTATANVNVVVNATPNPVPNSNSPICAGNALNLNVTAAQSYTWSGPNGFSSNLQNPVINNAQPVNSGNYTVVAAAPGGCTKSAVLAVVVNTNPIVTPFNNGPLCSGIPLNINVNSSTTYTSYQWSGPNGFSSTTASNTIANPNQNNSGNYTITITNAQGCASTQVMAVTVYSLPIPTALGATACVGQNTQLSASGGVGYQWTGPNGYSSTQQNPSFTNVQTNLSGIYTVVVSSANNCTASTTANLNIVTLPVPTASTSAVCQNQVLNLSSGGGASYQWFGPNGFTSNQQNPSIPNAQPNMSGTYTVIVTAASSCSAQTTVNATVNPLPSVNPSSNGPVCTGVPLNLNVNTAVSYTWSGPNNFSSNQQNPVITNPNVTNSGTYTVSVTNNFGCVNSSVTNVTIHPLPVPTALGATACVGQNTQLSASGGVGYAWTGPNGYTSNQQNPQFTNVQTNLSGVYTVVVTSANNCTASTTATLNIIPLPVPTASTSAVCQNQVLNLSAGGGSSYQWFGPNGFTSNQQNPSIPNAQPNMSGTYTVIVTAASSCSAQTTVNATVNPLPSVNPSSNGPVCTGVPLNLNVNTAVSYTWSGPNNFSSNQQNPVITNPNVTNSGTYTVSVTNNFGCVNSAVTNVSIHPLPVPTAVGATACVGQNTQLSSSGGVGYAWIGPNGFTSSQQNPSFTNVQTNLSGVYTVVVTSPNNCTAFTTASLNIISLPIPTATTSAVCQNQMLTFGAGGGASYVWLGPNGFSSNQQNPFIPNAQPNMSGTYTVIVTAATSCSNQTTVDATVHPLPNVTASNSGSVCELGVLTLNAAGALTYTWSGPGNFSSNAAFPIFTMALTSNSGTYMVIGTDANGCQNSAQTVVDVQPNPVVIVSGATVCSGNTATMGIQTTTLTSTIQWNGPNGFSSNAPTISINNVGASSSGVYSVLVTGVNGCTSSAQANLATYPNPTIMASFVSPTVCLGGTVHAIGDGGYQYAWNGPNGLVMSSEKEFQFVANSLDYTGIYTLTIIGAPYGCQNTTLIPLTVFDLPKANFIANDKRCVPFCTSMTIQPSQNSASFNQVLWTINNIIGANGNEAYYCMNAAGQVPVRVQIEDERGCKNIQTFSLVGYPKPVADFYWSPIEPREETEEVTFIDASKGTNLTGWSWIIQTHNGELQFSKNPLVYTFDKAGNYAVMMIVENQWGCKDSIIKAIRVVEDVVFYVPNAFSPNDDGVNDTFGPKGYGEFHFELTIYDRWGEKLFVSKKLDDPWDGTFNGEPCKEDLYVWKLNVILPGGKKEVKSGHVTLLR